MACRYGKIIRRWNVEYGLSCMDFILFQYGMIIIKISKAFCPADDVSPSKPYLVCQPRLRLYHQSWELDHNPPLGFLVGRPSRQASISYGRGAWIHCFWWKNKLEIHNIQRWDDVISRDLQESCHQLYIIYLHVTCFALIWKYLKCHLCGQPTESTAICVHVCTPGLRGYDWLEGLRTELVVECVETLNQNLNIFV